MKLRITITTAERLRNTLSTLVGLRKFCVLRFTPDHLRIISASINEPQIWCKINSDLFDAYEVESARENIISLEINIDSFYQVLRNFEKANSDAMLIRLQKKLANDMNNDESSSNGSTSSNPNKRHASLAVTYNEIVTSNAIGTSTAVNHSVKIPIRILTSVSDARLVEPQLQAIDLLLSLPKSIGGLFKRIERFKKSRNLSVCGDKRGYLSLILSEDDLKVILSWNEKLPVQKSNNNNNDTTTEDSATEDKVDDELFTVDVKLKDWKFGGKFCEICSNVVLILCHPKTLILHCLLDETEDVEIVYYVNGIGQNEQV